MAAYKQQTKNQHFKKFGTVVANAILKKKLRKKKKIMNM
jgi:hypothetical protein